MEEIRIISLIKKNTKFNLKQIIKNNLFMQVIGV